MRYTAAAFYAMILACFAACGGGSPSGDADTGTDQITDGDMVRDAAVDGDADVPGEGDPAGDIVTEDAADAVPDRGDGTDTVDDDAGDGDARDATGEEPEEECVGEGGSGPVIPDGPECCEGLEHISCATPGSEGICAEVDGVFCCTYCGDGDCGLGENYCNCGVDCSEEADCVGEGESHAVVPDAPDCCPGLVSVGCDAVGSDGSCIPCMGVVYCTKCGDGTCGPGENACRCPVDCT
jgi:hypothetical protein